MFHGIHVYMHKQIIMYTDMTTYIKQTNNTRSTLVYVYQQELKEKKH